MDKKSRATQDRVAPIGSASEQMDALCPSSATQVAYRGLGTESRLCQQYVLDLAAPGTGLFSGGAGVEQNPDYFQSLIASLNSFV
jgi:hypothetical protein